MSPTSAAAFTAGELSTRLALRRLRVTEHVEQSPCALNVAGGQSDHRFGSDLRGTERGPSVVRSANHGSQALIRSGVLRSDLRCSTLLNTHRFVRFPCASADRRGFGGDLDPPIPAQSQRGTVAEYLEQRAGELNPLVYGGAELMGAADSRSPREVSSKRRPWTDRLLGASREELPAHIEVDLHVCQTHVVERIASAQKERNFIPYTLVMFGSETTCSGPSLKG